MRRVSAALGALLLAVFLIALIAGADSVTAQAPTETFAHERPVSTTGPGPQRLPVDTALLTGGTRFRVVRHGERFVAEDGLADLRLATDGRAVPYLLISPPAAEPTWAAARPLPVPATKKTSGFEADLGSARPIDRLRVEGLPVPYLKRFSLEGSGDRQRWTVLVADGTLFDLPQDELRQNTVAFAAGPYRYLRLTWNDANSARVPLPAGVAARDVTARPPSPETTIEIGVERRPSEPDVSRYRLRLPAAGLPIVAVQLEVGDAHVHRQASISEARFAGVEAAPVELGTAPLVRVTRDDASAAALRVPIVAPAEAEIALTIQDGANPPLDVRRISAVLAELPWIYFEAPAGPVVARYGNPALTPPAYDLEAVRDTLVLTRVPEARWGEARSVASPAASTSTSLPNVGASLDTVLFTTTREIPSQTTGLVALPLDAHALANSRGPASRFADVRILDTASRQVPYLVERRSEPLAIDLSLRPASATQAGALTAASGRQRSVYTIALPYAGLPPATIVVDTSARVFQRRVQLMVERPADRRRREASVEVIAEDVWRHADEATPARPLSLRLERLEGREVLLVVDEGDNAPLPITAARVLLPSYRLRFYHPGEGILRLAYGRADLQPPQYDLALLAPHVMGASATEIAVAAASAAAPAEREPFISRRAFWALLSVVVLVLFGLIVRLVRQGTDGEGGS